MRHHTPTQDTTSGRSTSTDRLAGPVPEPAVLRHELDVARSALELARQDYAAARTGRVRVSELRSAYRLLGRAYRRAVLAAQALEARSPGTARGELAELRRAQQRHLLDAPHGVLLPMTVQARSHAPYRPLIAGLDFDPDDPRGASVGRDWGLDLHTVLDGLSARPVLH
jgi:hypothetical protein